MTMKSKFASKCVACGGLISVGEDIDWTRGVGAKHATVAQCNAAKSIPVAPAVKLDLSKVAEFLLAAQRRGLKFPKLRILDTDNRTEIRMSLTGPNSRVPNSIAVVVGGDFLGCIRPDGTVTSKLVSDTAHQAHLLSVADDPAAAAKNFAALTGLCSFCSKKLEDEGSTEVGYGPVCAKKWGLPHTPKGVRIPHPQYAPALRNQNAIPGWSAGIE